MQGPSGARGRAWRIPAGAASMGAPRSAVARAPSGATARNAGRGGRGSRRVGGSPGRAAGSETPSRIAVGLWPLVPRAGGRIPRGTVARPRCKLHRRWPVGCVETRRGRQASGFSRPCGLTRRWGSPTVAAADSVRGALVVGSHAGLRAAEASAGRRAEARRCRDGVVDLVLRQASCLRGRRPLVVCIGGRRGVAWRRRGDGDGRPQRGARARGRQVSPGRSPSW